MAGSGSHPLGVSDFAYAGEVALGVVLADPTGELADLKRSTQDYPAALSQALRDRLGEAADFARRAHQVLVYLGRREDSLGAAVDAAEQLVADVSRSCRR